jgi:Uma2 family endonuclease
MLVQIQHPERLIYPESDGKPMGENTLQVKWIVAILNGLEGVFRDRPDVFLAADLFWYPQYADPTNVTAPDVMVVFGRPKVDRPSYKQWEEENIPPQVVFEIQSPGNTADELAGKFRFYRRHQVEEYYLYDPATHQLQAWVRSVRKLVPVKEINGFVSPRLKVRFEVSESEPMKLIRPDGTRFRTYLELLSDAEEAQRQAAAERKQAESERKRAESQRKRADTAVRRADALAAKLRELGVDPDAL